MYILYYQHFLLLLLLLKKKKFRPTSDAIKMFLEDKRKKKSNLI